MVGVVRSAVLGEAGSAFSPDVLVLDAPSPLFPCVPVLLSLGEPLPLAPYDPVLLSPCVPCPLSLCVPCPLSLCVPFPLSLSVLSLLAPGGRVPPVPFALALSSVIS